MVFIGWGIYGPVCGWVAVGINTAVRHFKDFKFSQKKYGGCKAFIISKKQLKMSSVNFGRYVDIIYTYLLSTYFIRRETYFMGT